MDNLNLRTRIIAIFMLVLSFVGLIILVRTDSIAVFESSVYTRISSYINPDLTNVMIVVTNLGSSVVVIVIALAFLIIPFTRMKFGFLIAINAVISSGLNTVLKILIARDRPDILRLIAETGYGFPSGHAMNNTALYTIIILIVFRQTKNKKIRIPILICGITIPFFIGISRIYLGVHNAGDVLAGWIMGVSVALIVDTSYAIFQVKRKNNLIMI